MDSTSRPLHSNVLESTYADSHGTSVSWLDHADKHKYPSALAWLGPLPREVAPQEPQVVVRDASLEHPQTQLISAEVTQPDAAPHTCGKGPCKFHATRRGCKEGDTCSYCHICPWTMRRRRGRVIFAHQGAVPQAPGWASSLTPIVSVATLPGANEVPHPVPGLFAAALCNDFL